MSNAAMPASSTEASIGMSISSSIDIAPRRRFLDRLVPVAGIIGALADPAEGQHFGQLVVGEVVERRGQFFFDAVLIESSSTDSVSSPSSSTFSGVFAPVIVGRHLGLIFARAKDDPAQAFRAG